MRSKIVRLMSMLLVVVGIVPFELRAAGNQRRPAHTHKGRVAAAKVGKKQISKAARLRGRPQAVNASRLTSNLRLTTRKSQGALRATRARRNFRKPAGLWGAHIAGGPWREPTFADSTAGDFIDGEDLVVRRAAVEALGPFNGSVVVTEANTGRILTMVNQKLALRGAFQPCSTVKVMTALAGLSEGVIDASSLVRAGGRLRMTLTDALAYSNNPYFANIGVRLGFERIAYYARQLGLGETAGLNLAGEAAGEFPSAPPANGGMAMMTSFGEGIAQTPLQLAAIMGAIANGGTLYYLQYPRSPQEAEQLVPRVKRHLDIGHLLPALLPGLQAAVSYGTARRAAYVAPEPIYGKTGTCTDSRRPVHLGWFGSFTEAGGRKLVAVVLLTGGAPVNGSLAAGIAGNLYRYLSQSNYYAQVRPLSPAILAASPSF